MDIDPKEKGEALPEKPTITHSMASMILLGEDISSDQIMERSPVDNDNCNDIDSGAYASAAYSTNDIAKTLIGWHLNEKSYEDEDEEMKNYVTNRNNESYGLSLQMKTLPKIEENLNNYASITRIIEIVDDVSGDGLGGEIEGKFKA